MANVIVVGAQWGDEGKAKITDLLANEADVVVRCQGGCNAGHTVKHNGETFKFHLVPSGLLYPEKLCVIGSGVVIDPAVLLREIDDLKTRGYGTDNLKLSDRAHLTLRYHIELDKAKEAAAAKDKIGTTGKGIGPTYIDKVGRAGIRIGDLYDEPEILKQRIEQLLRIKNPILKEAFGLPGTTVEALLAYCNQYAEKLKPYVTDTVVLLHEQLAQNKKILFEGAQGTLLDVDYGTYPFVTSSNATAGGACTGSGIGPTQVDYVIGVMKAYITRVGEGPFPTELEDKIGQQLRDIGQEYGTTTGRPRRCGWFDAVIGRYSVLVNGLSGLAITKLDVMDTLSEVKICVAYKNKKTGETFTTFPSQLSALHNVEPVYETMPGWQQPVTEARKFEDLPKAAQNYLNRIAELTGARALIISVGPERNQTIVLENLMNDAPRSSRKSTLAGCL